MNRLVLVIGQLLAAPFLAALLIAERLLRRRHKRRREAGYLDEPWGDL